MIKKSLLLIPLLTFGCSSKEYHYYNVEYEWVKEEQRYSVYTPDKTYKIKDGDLHYVYVDQYPCTETCSVLAVNEFYVKGSNYRLYVYKLDK